jgi:hypothetical protein
MIHTNSTLHFLPLRPSGKKLNGTPARAMANMSSKARNLHYNNQTHYTTLHYTTLHYTALHHTTLHYSTVQYTTLHYTTLHYTTIHTLHYTHQ